MKLFLYFIVFSVRQYERIENVDAEQDLPTLCHVCKHSVDEFLNELSASNSRNVLKLGHVLQPEEHQKTIVYKKSELRLIEALENTCENLRNYKVHKDKNSNLRYSKDESSTFKTLNKLRERGVNVDLGFPDEMWDTPDAEVVSLKTQCENMIEEYEEEINKWYYNHQDNNLYDWLCRNRVLREKQKGKDCLQNSMKRNEKDEKVHKGKRNVHPRKHEGVKNKDNQKNKKINKKVTEFEKRKKKSAHTKNEDDLSEHDEL